MKTLRGLALSLFVGITLIGSAFAAEDNFPNRPITFIVAFPPGGSAGVVGRLVGDKLGSILGQTFVIEHRAGAGGANGSAAVAKAKPDGYTWLLATSGPISHVEAIRPKETPYRSLDDFEPVGLISATPVLLLARAGLNLKNMKDMVAYAKANPGKLTYGTTGIASVLHIQMLMLEKATGIQMLHVPYSGVGPQVAALAGGVVDLIIAGAPGSYQQIVVSGKGTAIASTGMQRFDKLPDVQTIEEQGFEGMGWDNWFGVALPAHTPAAIVKKAEAALVTAMADPQLRAQLAANGAVPNPGNAEKLRALMRSDLSKVQRVMKDTQLKLD